MKSLDIFKQLITLSIPLFLPRYVITGFRELFEFIDDLLDISSFYGARKREDYERFKEEKEEKHRVKSHPEIQMAKWIEAAQRMRISLDMVPKFFYHKIKECLSVLVKKGQLKKTHRGA